MEGDARVVAIVFAGGSGTRMGNAIPKQFLEVAGRPILAHTLELFQRHARIDAIYMAVHADYVQHAKGIAARHCIGKLAGVVAGGDSAQASIYNALSLARESGERDDAIVLVHDGVRPYVEPSVIDANVDSVVRHGNAVTYTPCVETLVISHDGKAIDALPYRRESYSAQAPQSFRLGDIMAAHERIRAAPGGYVDMVDQATICWTLGIPIHLVPGNRGNIKITTPEDVYTLKALMQYREDRQNGRTAAD